MEETAVPPTTEVFLERLDAWEASFHSSLRMSLEKAQLVSKILRAKAADGSGAAAAAAAAAAPRVHPGDVAVLHRLEARGTKFLKEVRGDLGEIERRHAEGDLSSLFEDGLGEVGQLIRSFQAIGKDTFQEALCNFKSGKLSGDDLRLFLKVGADVNGLVGGQTALIKAISIDSMEAVQMIVSDGASDMEARAGKIPPPALPPIEVLSRLDRLPRHPRHSVRQGDTALIVACRKGWWAMVEYLIESGAEVDVEDAGGRKVLAVACGAIWRKMDATPEAAKPALRSSFEEILKELTMKTSDLKSVVVHKDDSFYSSEALLHFAIKHDFEKFVNLLLSFEVGVDMMGPNYTTPLHTAAFRGRLKYLQLLIEKGADVNKREARGGGDTVLNKAICGFSSVDCDKTLLKVVELLLDHGAEVNAHGDCGYTALHKAVGPDRADMPPEFTIRLVKLLLNRGADVTARTSPMGLPSQQKTPAELVKDPNFNLGLSSSLQSELLVVLTTPTRTTALPR